MCIYIIHVYIYIYIYISFYTYVYLLACLSIGMFLFIVALFSRVFPLLLTHQKHANFNNRWGLLTGGGG